MSYGELIGGKNFAITLDPKQPVKEKAPKDYKVVGKSQPRVDIPDKVMGRFTYMQDFKVPGMLHGRVVRPPAIGAKLESVDDGAVKKIPGIVKVVREGNFLAVVASNEWDAIRGADALKAYMVEIGNACRIRQNFGTTSATARSQSSKSTEKPATPPRQWPPTGSRKSTQPMTSPSTRTARSVRPVPSRNLRTAHLTSWSASQATHNLRKQLAQMFSLPPEKVHCIYLEGSGCYGRNGHEDAAADAALLAKSVGKPVRVQWSRADEHGWDPKGPPTLMDMRAAMDAQGNVTAWEGDFYMPQQTPGGFLVPLVAATLSGLPAADHIAPGNVFQNSAIPYKFAKHEVGVQTARDDTVPSILDQDAGAHAEHLRQRMLHGRTCGGGRNGPARISPEVSRRQAGPRIARAAGRSGQVG